MNLTLMSWRAQKIPNKLLMRTKKLSGLTLKTDQGIRWHLLQQMLTKEQIRLIYWLKTCLTYQKYNTIWVINITNRLPNSLIQIKSNMKKSRTATSLRKIKTKPNWDSRIWFKRWKICQVVAQMLKIVINKIVKKWLIKNQANKFLESTSKNKSLIAPSLVLQTTKIKKRPNIKIKRI